MNARSLTATSAGAQKPFRIRAKSQKHAQLKGTATTAISQVDIQGKIVESIW
ncbi:MAG: hypothetical protein QXJ94_04720 [Candidatus Bathyarchaeia archaeon]